LTDDSSHAFETLQWISFKTQVQDGLSFRILSAADFR